jgi:hypothetical protein
LSGVFVRFHYARFIYEYASLYLKVELRKLSRNDQSRTEIWKQIVRMEDWLVAQRFDFVNYIRTMLSRGSAVDGNIDS